MRPAAALFAALVSLFFAPFCGTAFADAPGDDLEPAYGAVTSRRDTFRIQQYTERSPTSDSSRVETWLLASSTTIVDRRLPEVSLADVNPDDDSGDIGYPSSFAISPDDRFIFREQKIYHGGNAAYLYVRVRDNELTYRPMALAGRRLDLAVKRFFARQVGGVELEQMGIVEFVTWDADEKSLVVSLRGREIAGYEVNDWQCTIDLDVGRVLLTDAQRRRNRGTFTKMTRR
jgi:hypothetical protein